MFPNRLGLLASAALIALNWLVFIYAVALRTKSRRHPELVPYEKHSCQAEGMPGENANRAALKSLPNAAEVDGKDQPR